MINHKTPRRQALPGTTVIVKREEGHRDTRVEKNERVEGDGERVKKEKIQRGLCDLTDVRR